MFFCWNCRQTSVKVAIKNIEHRQKHVEIVKDCLWIELQNYYVESAEKKN